MKQFRNKWHLKELSSNIRFYTVSDKSYISIQNETAGDSVSSVTWERSQIYIHKLNPSGHGEVFFLVTCNLGRSLNMHIMYFLIVKTWLGYILSYLMPLILLSSVSFLPKNILKEYELNWFSDRDHSLVPACIFKILK